MLMTSTLHHMAQVLKTRSSLSWMTESFSVVYMMPSSMVLALRTIMSICMVAALNGWIETHLTWFISFLEIGIAFPWWWKWALGPSWGVVYVHPLYWLSEWQALTFFLWKGCGQCAIGGRYSLRMDNPILLLFLVAIIHGLPALWLYNYCNAYCC